MELDLDSPRPPSRFPYFFTKGRWDPYESPVTGKVISNETERQADLKAAGCVPYDELMPYGQSTIKREE